MPGYPERQAADTASLPCHRCIIDNGHPSCNFTFDAVSRALGLSQTRRVPAGGTVTFTSCSVYMDEGVVTSPTCFEVSALQATATENPQMRSWQHGADHERPMLQCVIDCMRRAMHVLVCFQNVSHPWCMLLLQDDSTTAASLTVPFAEGSVSKISFISTYHDSSPDGPPGALLTPWWGCGQPN